MQKDISIPMENFAY